jgi:hypothetical protein
MSTQKVYQNDNERYYVSGKAAGFRSTYRVGRSSDGVSNTNYQATSIYTYGKEVKVGWLCGARPPRKYTVENALPNRHVEIDFDGSPQLISLSKHPPEFPSTGDPLFGAFARANSAQVQLGVELAEVLKTARTLSAVVNGSLRFIVDFKKSLTSRRHRKRFINKVLGKSNLDDVASAYMAFRFGIRPIVYGVQSALDLHNEGIKKDLLFWGQESDSLSVSSNGYTCSQTKRVRLTYIVDDPELFARAQLGLSSSELASIGWELLPLSWAVDYILPIGDYIQSLSRGLNRPGCKFVNMLSSIKSRASYSQNDSHTVMYCYNQYSGTTSSVVNYNSTHYERHVYNTEPSVPLPKPSFDLDAFQILDLMALARGLTK